MTGSTADFLRSVEAVNQATPTPQITELEVLDENWTCIEVFRFCSMTYIQTTTGGGMAPVIVAPRAVGFSATEIRNAFALAGVELDAETVTHVHELGALVAKAMNTP